MTKEIERYQNLQERLTKRRRELGMATTTGQGIAYLVLDCSESMAGEKLKNAKSGAADFAQTACKNGYLVGVIAFSDSARIIAQPQSATAGVESRLGTLTADGGTDIAAALRLARESLRIPVTRVITLVTDGQPQDPGAAIYEANRAKQVGIEIFTIGTDDADLEFLRKISSAREFATWCVSMQLGSSIAQIAGLLPQPKQSK